MSLLIQEHVPLAMHTTFKIGGKARYFVEIYNEAELRDALAWARAQAVPYALLAGGSNALISDGGFDGLVIHIKSTSLSFDGLEVVIDAGCNLLESIRAASQQGLGGWEKLAGIPGTVGGAVRGNAGAFGSEIQDFVTSVRALHIETGDIRVFQHNECAFAYRQSYFKSHPEWIVTTATLHLLKIDTAVSIRLIEETITEREKRHLQNVMAAGSYFMNPVAPQHIIELFETEKNTKARDGRVPAGWLIEKAGMKGRRVGGAQASEKHPNYIINTGAATSSDVHELAQQIKEAVLSQFDIELQEEAVSI